MTRHGMELPGNGESGLWNWESGFPRKKWLDRLWQLTSAMYILHMHIWSNKYFYGKCNFPMTHHVCRSVGCRSVCHSLLKGWEVPLGALFSFNIYPCFLFYGSRKYSYPVSFPHTLVRRSSSHSWSVVRRRRPSRTCYLFGLPWFNFYVGLFPCGKGTPWSSHLKLPAPIDQ